MLTRALEIVPLKVISCEDNLMSTVLLCNNAIMEKVEHSYATGNLTMQ